MDWAKIKDATSPEDKPTPGWLFHEIIQDLQAHPYDAPEVVQHLAICITTNHMHVQMKALLCVKHIAVKVPSFQLSVQRHPYIFSRISDLANRPELTYDTIQERLLREAAQNALLALASKPDETALVLQRRIQGFGSTAVRRDTDTAVGTVGRFVGESVQEMVDDFKTKGAVGALRDATLDAVDLVSDGVGAVAGILRSVLGGRSDLPPITMSTSVPYTGPEGLRAAGNLPLALPWEEGGARGSSEREPGYVSIDRAHFEVGDIVYCIGQSEACQIESVNRSASPPAFTLITLQSKQCIPNVPSHFISSHVGPVPPIEVTKVWGPPATSSSLGEGDTQERSAPEELIEFQPTDLLDLQPEQPDLEPADPFPFIRHDAA